MCVGYAYSDAAVVTLVDSGCLNYGIISEAFAKQHQLPVLDIAPQPAYGVTGEEIQITRVIQTSLDISTRYGIALN